MSLILATQPVAAVTPLLETDVAAFSSRAEAWTSARDTLRADSLQQAVQVAEDVRQAEADRVAAAETAREREFQRQAAAAAALTTTTSPPTTVPPPTTTTRAPTTTAPDANVLTPSPTTVPTPTTTESLAGAPNAAQWNVLRECESSNNYSVVSVNGRYRGAYQFSQATWDWVASLDDPSLVGVDPAAAAPATQDAMAFSLWSRQGWHPWPICGDLAAAA